MTSTLLSLLPVLAGVLAGALVRRSGLAGQGDGEFVFRLVIFVCLPTLMFTSLSQVEVTAGLAVFALAAPVSVALGHLAGRAVARTGLYAGTQVPVLLLAGMMINGAFPLPFVQALYGLEGVARVAVFDAVNSALTFTWASWVAARGNPDHSGGGLLWRRLLLSPPLLGIVAGLAVNVADVTVPDPVQQVLTTFGAATGLLIPLGVGLLLSPVRGQLRRAAGLVGTRLGSALVAGMAVVTVFGLQGADRGTLLLLSVAPLAFSTVAFSSLEKLDVPLATAALSLSLLTSVALSLGIAVVVGA